MSHLDIDTQLQDAAVDPSLWPRALQSIADFMGAVGGNFLPVTGHVPDFPFSPSLAEAAERYVGEGWMFRDERAPGIPKLLNAGTFVDQDVIAAEKIAHSPYYQEFLAPLNLRWFAGLGFRAGDDVWCLALQRTPEQGYFTPDEEGRLLTLQGALSRAATLADLLGQARADGALTAFEAMNRSCFLLDRLGRVVRMTASARSLLGTDLLLTNGVLRPVLRARAADLAQLIAAALWAATKPHARHLKAITLDRTGQKPLLVQAQPLRGHARDLFGSAAVALTIIDLGRKDPVSEAVMRKEFSLTPSEGRLLVALADAGDLRGAALACGIGYETARTYLKSIFLKTGTHTQADLLLLAARSS